MPQVQSKHFGGSLKVSIEGYAVHYRNTEKPEALTLDFHSYLSDDRTQLASTVQWHMDDLIKKLLKKGTLKKFGRVLSTTDGCAAQYKCATALYFQTLLACKHKIVITRDFSEAGHGKSVVDAINGVDKNTISRYSMRSVQSADDAFNKESPSLKVHSFNNSSNGEVYSAAEDCKRILELGGHQGVKSDGLKREKRHANRGINHRYWTVRPLIERLSEAKAKTIKICEEGVSFRDMYHTYCSWELGKGVAGLRRVPCHCKACETIIRLPWSPGVAAKDQPRFQQIPDCHLRPVLDDYNKWYIVEIEDSKEGDPEDTAELYHDVLHHMTSVMAMDIEIGSIGAVCTVDKKNSKDGYYLIQFTSLPFTAQVENGTLQVKGQWVNELPGAPLWFYQEGGLEVTVELTTVLATSIKLIPFSADNQPRGNITRKQAEDNDAMRMTQEDHDTIMDEIQLRDRLEYDPMMVMASEEEEGDLESSDSDSEDEY